MSEHLHVVILAGGSGTRFWPLSREGTPKQFLRIISDCSMFALTLKRALRLVPEDRIWVVTVRGQTDGIRREIEGLALHRVRVIEEPLGRNTAAAIGLAAVMVGAHDPAGILAVLPADHHIRDESRFTELMRFGTRVADAGWLTTLGIRPHRPETGYGYIGKGERIVIDTDDARAPDQCADIHRAERFTEKPDRETAQSYLRSGNFFWNGGIFLWKAVDFLEEMRKFLPGHYRGLFAIGREPGRVGEIYPTLESVSVDYGILERSDRVAVIPADMGWSDVGSWTALYEILEKDGQDNVLRGDVIALDTERSLIRSEHRLVAAIGVEDLIVIETEDAVLVCREARSQDVREVARLLAEAGRKEARERPRVEKPWGAYQVLDEGEGYQVKWLDISPGKRLSYQSHSRRSEHWTVVAGTATVTLDDQVREIPAGGDIFIPLGGRHRIENRTRALVRIIEVQTGGYLGEDDIIRFEDDYGRA
jgi:mannose-1-phosphate guanylyltransferase/mannose-6-phosphate isomerase